MIILKITQPILDLNIYRLTDSTLFHKHENYTISNFYFRLYEIIALGSALSHTRGFVWVFLIISAFHHFPDSLDAQPDILERGI